MNQKQEKKNVKIPSSELSEKDGLSLSYDKKELIDQFPNLISEINHERKVLKIDSIESKPEEGIKPNNEYNYCEDLSHPGAIDFIRRCQTIEEAKDVLEYLLKRKEISDYDYQFLVKKISEQNGLQELIAQCGGSKTPGYYLRKYYSDKKINNLKKPNSNQNLN